MHFLIFAFFVDQQLSESFVHDNLSISGYIWYNASNRKFKNMKSAKIVKFAKSKFHKKKQL